MRSGMRYKQHYTGIMILFALLFTFLIVPHSGHSAPLPGVEEIGEISISSSMLYSAGRLAVEKNGTLYISDGYKNHVLKYDRKGNYLGDIQVNYAEGIAVSQNGTLYAGSNTDMSVGIYENGSLTGQLGGGAYEFATIRDIAVDDDTGDVYVADANKHVVKVYDASGIFIRDFGGLHLPIGVDIVSGNVYILDTPQVLDPNTGYYTTGARVTVYTTGGGYVTTFSDHIVQGGNLYRPKDLSVDSSGNIYVCDSYYNKVFAYDNTGALLGEIESTTDIINTAISLAVAPDGRMYVSSSNTYSVNKFGLDGYTYMEASPLSLSYSADEGGSNPASQAVTISNSGTGDLTYTATPSDSWIQVDQPTGIVSQKSSAAINVSADITGLVVGSYSGSVTITDTAGATEVVAVSLDVTEPPLPPSLSVTPLSLAFSAVYGSGNPSGQNVTIQIDNDSGGTITWTASPDAGSSSWLSINPTSGTGDTITQATVSVDVTGMAGGTYAGQITVDAPGAENSPAVIDVMLTIEYVGTIQVTTNTIDASFSITGPGCGQPCTGSGMSWSRTGLEDGNYTIQYNDVMGHKTPPSETLTIAGGSTIDFVGTYVDLRKKVNIIASHGPGNKDSSEIGVFVADDPSATPESKLTIFPFDYTYGSSTAVGDVDGDGSLDIVAGVGPGSRVPAQVRAFTRDGNAIVGIDFLAFDTKFGVVVATADFNGDGTDEIITGQGKTSSGKKGKTSSGVNVHTYQGNLAVETGASFTAYFDTENGVRVASGDLDGDAVPELITAPEDSSSQPTVNIYRVNTTQDIPGWTTSPIGSFSACDNPSGANITTGDTDADGVSEILVVCPSEAGTEVRIFKMNENMTVASMTSFTTASTLQDYIAAGDTDMDGAAEIIIGAGPKKNNQTVTVYKYDIINNLWEPIHNFEPFSQSQGIRVSVGDLGYTGGAQ